MVLIKKVRCPGVLCDLINSLKDNPDNVWNSVLPFIMKSNISFKKPTFFLKKLAPEIPSEFQVDYERY